MGEIIVLCVAAYLLGSVPFAKIFCAIGGVDIQKRGSGNIGFANVHRIMGWRYSLPTLVSDIAKGYVPTYAALIVTQQPAIAFWVGICAVIGHIFPIWLRFRGGKGIATGLGLAGVLVPFLALFVLVMYFVLLGVYKMQPGTISFAGVIVVGLGLVFVYSAWWMAAVLLAITLFTLRKNLFGGLPDHG